MEDTPKRTPVHKPIGTLWEEQAKELMEQLFKTATTAQDAEVRVAAAKAFLEHKRRT